MAHEDEGAITVDVSAVILRLKEQTEQPLRLWASVSWENSADGGASELWTMVNSAAFEAVPGDEAGVPTQSADFALRGVSNPLALNEVSFSGLINTFVVVNIYAVAGESPDAAVDTLQGSARLPLHKCLLGRALASEDVALGVAPVPGDGDNVGEGDDGPLAAGGSTSTVRFLSTLSLSPSALFYYIPPTIITPPPLTPTQPPPKRKTNTDFHPASVR